VAFSTTNVLDKSGVTVYWDKPWAKYNEPTTSTAIPSLEWNHLVIVFAKENQTMGLSKPVEDEEYYNAIKIYLNGCLISAK
jgi:hypothetical protein